MAAPLLRIPVGFGVTGLVARNGTAGGLAEDSPRNPVHRHCWAWTPAGRSHVCACRARGLEGGSSGWSACHRSVDAPVHGRRTSRLATSYADLLGLRLQVMDLRTVDAHRDDRDRLIAQAISAQEAERRRIASDLHDGVTTAIASMAFHLNAADLSTVGGDPRRRPVGRREARPGALAIGVRTAQGLADRAYTQTRAAITGLHSLVLDDLGLVAALESCGRDSSGGRDGDVCDAEEEFADVPDHAAAALFRIAQESTSNAIRHGHAPTGHRLSPAPRRRLRRPRHRRRRGRLRPVRPARRARPAPRHRGRHTSGCPRSPNGAPWWRRVAAHRVDAGRGHDGDRRAAHSESVPSAH